MPSELSILIVIISYHIQSQKLSTIHEPFSCYVMVHACVLLINTSSVVIALLICCPTICARSTTSALVSSAADINESAYVIDINHIIIITRTSVLLVYAYVTPIHPLP
jgi:hypothetical protein